jgi:hypothetical protein
LISHTKTFLTEESVNNLKQSTTKTVQKPFNSPMLIASVISVSASSPASGECPADFGLHPLTQQVAGLPI